MKSFSRPPRCLRFLSPHTHTHTRANNTTPPNQYYPSSLSRLQIALRVSSVFLHWESMLCLACVSEKRRGTVRWVGGLEITEQPTAIISSVLIFSVLIFSVLISSVLISSVLMSSTPQSSSPQSSLYVNELWHDTQPLVWNIDSPCPSDVETRSPTLTWCQNFDVSSQENSLSQKSLCVRVCGGGRGCLKVIPIFSPSRNQAGQHLGFNGVVAWGSIRL